MPMDPLRSNLLDLLKERAALMELSDAQVREIYWLLDGTNTARLLQLHDDQQTLTAELTGMLEKEK
jgi:hypothetical protein